MLNVYLDVFYSCDSIIEWCFCDVFLLSCLLSIEALTLDKTPPNTKNPLLCP